MKKHLLTTWLLSIMMVFGVGSAWADEITATLVHTASSGVPSKTAGAYVSTIDAAEEYINNSAFGNAAWQGAAYAEFSFAIPEGHAIQSANMVWNGKGSSKDRTTDVLYVNPGLTLDYSNTGLGSGTAEVNLAATKIGTVTFPKSTTKEFTTDVTNAVKAVAGTQSYIIFKFTNNVGAGNLIGKGAETGAPTLVITTVSAASQTKYTVKFVDEAGNQIKDDAVYDGTIGQETEIPAEDKANFYNNDKSKKYIFKSSSDAVTLVADAASNVITLTFREAAIYNYTVNFIAGETILGSKTGAVFEGDETTVSYPKYLANEGQLYTKDATNKEYNYKFTPAADAEVKTLEYTAVEGVINVALVTEGEDVEDLTPCTSANTGIRSSNSASAYATADTKIAVLGPGTYKLHAIIYDASKEPNSHWIFKAGETQIADFNCTTVNIQEFDSEEFTIEGTTNLILAAAGNANMGLDAFYITGNGEATAFENAYTLVGNCTAIFGTEWDVNNTANNLVKGEDNIYTKMYQGVELTNGYKVEYKVVKNNSYDNGQWPLEGNADYTVWEGDAKYDVAFTFDLNKNTVSCDMKKHIEEPAITDYTEFIINADLSNKESTAWNTEGTKGYHNVGGVVTAARNAQFDFCQEIKNLPAGQYKLTAQAAYRYGDNEQAEYDAIQGGTDTKLAKLYAKVGTKENSSQLLNRWDAASETNYYTEDASKVSVVNGKYVPNSTAAVKAWFAAGQYVNEVVFNLVEDGDVFIGILKDATPDAGDFTVIGPWTLTRLGDAQEEVPAEQNFTATFNNGDNWENVYAYTWTSGEPVVEQLGAWPGTKLEKNAETSLYDVTITAVEAPEFIIFNNGLENEALQQTADLAFVNEKAYEYRSIPELAGWTKVTSANIENVADNYYVLVDADSYNYVMSNEADHYRPCYKTVADPVANPSFVWSLEGSDNTFAIKSFSTGSYFIAPSNGWDTSMTGATGSATFQFTQNDGIYTLKCVQSNALVGHWNDSGAAVANDGENIAANKQAKDAPGFYLYAMPKATYEKAILAARTEATAGASKENGIDVTAWIQNADWTGDYGGWARSGSWGNMQWGQKTLEVWNATNVVVKQTLTAVPDGTYKLTADVISGNGDNKVAFVYGTGGATEKSDAVSAVASAGNYNTMSAEVAGNTLTADNIVVTGGVLTVGLDIAAGWIVADNFKLYYYGEDMSQYAQAYHDALTAAQAIDTTAPMNGEVLTALNTALTTYASVDETNKATLLAATTALSTATEAATASIAAYAKAAEMLPKMKQLTEETNVYTAEALASYYTQWADKYEAKTLTTEEANALQNPYTQTGWHDNITVDNFLLSAWDTNPDFVDAPYYINTWSTEGIEGANNYAGVPFGVPFFEYWTSDANSLGEKTLTATMSNLPEGKYNVTTLVRVRIKNGAETPAAGITLQANEGEAVDVTAGDQIGESQFFLKEFTATGTVAQDGVLNIKFSVAADNNISWLSFKNVKFEKVEPAEPVYYVVGTMNNWTPSDEYKMTLNEEAEGVVEYMITLDLEANAELKVVKNNSEVWYPEGTDNNFQISEAGEYDIYFRPNADGADDWYYGVIYVAPKQNAQPEFPENIIYSWESPEGTPVEYGGTIAYVNGDGDRLNYQNSGYYTICLNGKKANLNDEAASANAGHMVITLDNAVAEGDTIAITGYITKNSSSKSSAWIVYENGSTTESAVFGDESNIFVPEGGEATGAINTKYVIVSAEAAGSKTITLTRGQTGTNLFITKLQVISKKAEEPVETIETMYLMGELTGGWDFQDTQKMTQDAENAAVWTLTVEAFEAEAKTYKYKATANAKWGLYELPASGDYTFTFGTDEYPAGKYDLKFTVNTTDNTLTLVVTKHIEEGITMLKAAIENGNVYNMNGQKVNKAQKGLYIINGRKVVIK